MITFWVIIRIINHVNVEINHGKWNVVRVLMVRKLMRPETPYEMHV